MNRPIEKPKNTPVRAPSAVTPDNWRVCPIPKTVNPIPAAIPKESNSETIVHKLVDKSTMEARSDVEYQNATAKDTRMSAPLTNRRMNRIQPLRISSNITDDLAPRPNTQTPS